MPSKSPWFAANCPKSRRATFSPNPWAETAAAIALAAAHIQRETAAPDKSDRPGKAGKPGSQDKDPGDAVMAILPADHFIAQAARYRKIVRAALQVASPAGYPGGSRYSPDAARNRIRLH